MKNKIWLIIVISIISIYWLIKAESILWEITLEIMAWPISIIWSWTINTTTITNSPDTGTITSTVTNNIFNMEDLRWWLSYYTTIQFDDLIKWSDIIPSHLIRLKSLPQPAIIHWNTNEFIRFGSWIKSSLYPMHLPVTYFLRIPYTSTWDIWLYWDKPQLEITVPPYTTWWTYRWKIYYTLYDIQQQ